MYFPAVEVLQTMGLCLSRSLIDTHYLRPEERLWRGVLVNAFEDALIKHSDRKSSLQKGQAHNWFIERNINFKKVCGWGDLDHALVHEAYIKAIYDGKIRFTMRQVMWNKYNSFSRSIQKIKEDKVKRQYKGEIKKFRQKVMLTPTCYVTTVFISVVA